MKGLKSMLLKEQQYLETICSKAEEELKSSPDGCLRVSKDKHKIRYYHCTTNRNGTYISSNDMELVRQLAQKKYNQSILKKGSESDQNQRKFLQIIFIETILYINMKNHYFWKDMVRYIRILLFYQGKQGRKFIGNMKEWWMIRNMQEKQYKK